MILRTTDLMRTYVNIRSSFLTSFILSVNVAKPRLSNIDRTDQLESS